jgi:hypothetical protein
MTDRIDPVPRLRRAGAALLLGATAVASGGPSLGQLDDDTRAEVIAEIAECLEEQHVFPDVGRKLADHLRERLASGAYDEFVDPMQFSRAVTGEMRELNPDRHLGLYVEPPHRFGDGDDELEPDPVEARRRLDERFRIDNYGFSRVEMIDGVIGYLDLDIFAPAEVGGDTAFAAMQLLANSKALIIDLRNNRGGSGTMIQVLCSYFFPEETLLCSFETRGVKEIRQARTLPHVPGPKFYDTPIFILTSERTGSAAEEFTYDLKHLDRATVVGEVTGGAGHTVSITRIADTFNVHVPHGRPIHPVTGTDWDGVGVQPDIAVDEDGALLRARYEALRAASASTLDPITSRRIGWALAAVESELHPLQLGIEQMQMLQGRYGPLEVAVEDGELIGRRGASTFRLVPLQDRLFAIEGLEMIRLEFISDEAGDIVAVENHFRDGRRLRFDRMP